MTNNGQPCHYIDLDGAPFLIPGCMARASSEMADCICLSQEDELAMLRPVSAMIDVGRVGEMKDDAK